MADPKNAFVTAMVFLLALDLFAGMLVATGINDTLGLSISPSDSGASDEIEGEFEEQQDTGAATQDTLFGLYNQLASSIGTLSKAINPGLNILNNAGAPKEIFNQFLYPIVTVIKGVGIAFFARGL